MNPFCPLPLSPEDRAFLPRLHAALVAEIYRQSGAALGALALLLTLLKILLRESGAQASRLDGIFLTLGAVIFTRALFLLLLHRYPTLLPAPRTRHLLFIAGTTLTSLIFLSLNIAAFPLLPPFALAGILVCEAGISSTAMVTMGGSPLAYLLYTLPMVGSSAFMMAFFPPPGLPSFFALITCFFIATQVVVALGVHRSLRDNILMQLKLKDSALRDTLTGLRNRRYLLEFIEVELGTVIRSWHPKALAKGLPAQSMAIIMLDLDHFKSVNDTYGHAAGDAVLVQMARLMRRLTRRPDLAVRWGGEEFVVLALDAPRELPLMAAERIRRAVEMNAFELPSGECIQRTCSVGYALYPFLPDQPGALDWEQVLNLADFAMYQAKAQGRNRVVGLRPASNDPRLIQEMLHIGDKALQASLAAQLLQQID